MDLIFETKGSTGALKQWLQSFKEINDTLLVEVDLEDDLFIAKSFTDDKTIVKYGKISFELCNLTVLSVNTDDGRQLSVSEWINEHPSQRIYIGFLNNLDSVIKQFDFFSSEDVYKIIVRFEEVAVDGVGKLYCATKLEFKSRSVNMLAPVYSISEFTLNLLDDNKFFNGVAAIPNPLTFELGPNVNTSLIRASEIHSKDAKKDIIKFIISDETDGWCLRAQDHTNNLYDFRMSGHIVEGSSEPAAAISPITRANYIIANKGDKSENSFITISTDSTVQNGRMKIETGDGQFTTVIANVRIS